MVVEMVRSRDRRNSLRSLLTGSLVDAADAAADAVVLVLVVFAVVFPVVFLSKCAGLSNLYDFNDDEAPLPPVVANDVLPREFAMDRLSNALNPRVPRNSTKETKPHASDLLRTLASRFDLFSMINCASAL